MKRTAALVVFVLGSIITCTGTNGGSSTSSSSSGMATGPEPIYAGGATDECWRSFVDARPNTTEDAVKGGTFIIPTEGASLAPDFPSTFTWSTPLASYSPSLDRQPAPQLRRALELQLFATALAHGDPVTGDITWVFFHIPGQEDVTVLSTENSWTPETAAWNLLKAAGTQEITAEIYSAYATQNRISDGPYKAPGVRRFRIQ